MTCEEFIEAYCRDSDVTWDEISKDCTPMPCACGFSCCLGWAMVSTEPAAMKAHQYLYAPTEGAEKP